MIPKLAIELAIKGGWSHTVYELKDHHITHQLGDGSSIALDPTFWQSLGKALGWEYTLDRMKISNPDPMERDKIAKEWGVKPDWQHYAHRFYDLILEGKPTEDYWKELLPH